jgi:peroxiredoxin
MSVALLGSQLLLIAVFLLAGVTKLASRQGTRNTLIDFGLSSRLASKFAIFLPLVELMIAFLLIPRSLAWWGAAGTLVLLSLFTIAIAVNLARGRKPPCQCFGQLHSAPIGWSTVARNVALGAIAGFVMWGGKGNAGLGPGGILIEVSTGLTKPLALWLGYLSVLAFVGWLFLHLFRQNGRLMLRVEALESVLTAVGVKVPDFHALGQGGLPVGSPAPAFEAPTLEGGMITMKTLRVRGKALVLVFSDPGCDSCNALLPFLVHWQKEYEQAMVIALVSRGTIEANRAKTNEHRLANVLVQADREISNSYKVYETPTAVAVLPDGMIGSSLAKGPEAIRALIANLARMQKFSGNGHGDKRLALAEMESIGLETGRDAPQFELPDLDGTTTSLSNFEGSETLLLFWNPACGFCTRMLNDLKAWERSRPENSPLLLVISTGTVQENRSQGFLAPVLLDDDFSVGRLFGVQGTPSGVLISPELKIASRAAVGGSAVLALTGAPAIELKSTAAA